MINPDELEPQYSRIFRKSIDHYAVTSVMLLFYQFAKFVIGFLILFALPFILSDCSTDQGPRIDIGTQFHPWILCVSIHAFFLFFAYSNHVNFISKPENKQLLAERLGQIRLIPGQLEEPASISEDSRKISILSRQIKGEVLKQTCFGRKCLKFLIICYQLLFIYGMILFFYHYYNVNQCNLFEFYFLAVILVLSIFQYIDHYIIMIFAVLCSPFLLIFGIYYIFSLCVKEQEIQERRNRLNPQKYKSNLVEGDQECPICKCAYEIDEKVIVLACSKYHHFHDSCIMSWLNVNHTCPLCRRNV